MLDNRGLDQAEGLRRILGAQQPRRLGVLSAVSPAHKNAVLLNLAAALVNAGSTVQLLDASQTSTGIATHAFPVLGSCLLSVAQQDLNHELALREQAPGVRLAQLSRLPLKDALQADEIDMLSLLLRTLKPDSNYWLIDIELEQDDPFVLPEIAQSELIVLTSTAASSIKRAYSQIKALQARLGKRPCHLLVVGATTQQAELVQQNMAQAASRYLEIALTSLGSIPADEQLLQAESMGRALVSSQPQAEASVAFRRIATQLMSSIQGMPDFSSAGMAAARRA